MTFPSMHACIAAAALAATSGCATQETGAPRAWRIEPVLQVRHSPPDSEAYYRTGRYFDGMQSWDRAIDAYRKAIAADESNVEARNALGVALARRGDFAQAEDALRRALTADPGRAHVRSNLGYVLMLSGKTAQAVAELQVAVARDAADEVARDNLTQARAQADEVAAVSYAVAAPLPMHDVRAPEAPVGDNGAAAAPAMRVIDTPTVAAWTTESADGSLPAAPLPSPLAATLALPRETFAGSLELSNGSGVRGAADRLRRWLSGRSTAVQRLTNQKPYVQQHTVIQYRSGHEADARLLQRMLGFGAVLEQVAPLRSDVRVVIGHDWNELAACLEAAACEKPTQVAQAPSAS